MNRVDLDKLEVLTKDYAAFQARKSGLGTALGGLLALMLIVGPMLGNPFHPCIAGLRWNELMLLTPMVWILARHLLGRWLYAGLGRVRPEPDAVAERARWRWVFGIGCFLLAFLTAALAGFLSGILGGTHDAAYMAQAKAWLPGLWVALLPFLYLAAAPLAVRGVEEGRVYAVLVVQCCLWLWNILVFGFLGWRPGPEPKIFTAGTVLGVLGLALAVTAWAGLAMVRGWQEHRQFMAMLKSLPGEHA